jgi:hypothetical protein
MHVFKNNNDFSYQLQSWLVSKNWVYIGAEQLELSVMVSQNTTGNQILKFCLCVELESKPRQSQFLFQNQNERFFVKA